MVAASTSITALADTISIPLGFGPYQYNYGGEITATLSSGVSGYVPGVTSGFVNSGSFQTFCVEFSESLVVGTFTAIPANMTTMTGFTLNKGTAWLYEQFAAGTLSGYNYGPDATIRKVSANALQQEIWHLMGNQAAANSIFDPIVDAAALAGNWNKLDANTTEFSDTRLLNMWVVGQVGQSAGARQDLLFIPGFFNDTPGVPDGGLTLALLGMGLTSVGFVSRHVRK